MSQEGSALDRLKHWLLLQVMLPAPALNTHPAPAPLTPHSTLAQVQPPQRRAEKLRSLVSTWQLGCPELIPKLSSRPMSVPRPFIPTTSRPLSPGLGVTSQTPVAVNLTRPHLTKPMSRWDTQTLPWVAKLEAAHAVVKEELLALKGRQTFQVPCVGGLGVRVEVDGAADAQGHRPGRYSRHCTA